MDTNEKQQEHVHNGCVGHPVTNLLMNSAQAFRAGAEHEPFPFVAEPDELAEEIPPEVLASIEAAFDDLAGKVESAVRQVGATDERTAHLVILCESIAREQDAQGKLLKKIAAKVGAAPAARSGAK